VIVAVCVTARTISTITIIILQATLTKVTIVGIVLITTITKVILTLIAGRTLRSSLTGDSSEWSILKCIGDVLRAVVIRSSAQSTSIASALCMSITEITVRITLHHAYRVSLQLQIGYTVKATIITIITIILQCFRFYWKVKAT